MKTSFTLLIATLLCSVSMYSQRSFGQYSIEAGYGIGISGKPGLTDKAHFNFGGRYMVDETWGIKLDYGHDKFRTKDSPERGVDYDRISLQYVYNLGRYLNFVDNTDGMFGLLGHAGVGLSIFNSTETSNTDHIGDILMGLTPQIYLSERVSIHADATYIVHVKQHFNFSGEYRDPNGPKAFVGGQFNASIGLTLYLGRNRSDNDWR